MANNKIVYNNQTLIDLTSDTATAADVAQGKTFHLADGTQATGTAQGGGGDTIYEVYNTTGATYQNNTMTSIPPYMFVCSKITSLSLPACTNIAACACMECYSLTSLYLPEVITVGSNSFEFCSNLTSVSLPKATSVEYNSFASDTNLEHASLPKITTVTANCFSGCSRLLDVEVGPVTSVAANAFKNCSACLVYDFTNCTAVPTLLNTNAFTGINASAQIKVPSSLESTWKTINKWNTYASYIVGV